MISISRVPLRAIQRMASIAKILAGLAVIGVVFTASASAGEPELIGTYDVNVSHGLTFTGNKSDMPAPLALRGYDTVNYFTEGKPKVGNSTHAALHRGAIYWFASEEHKKMFVANPDRYVPQYGGFCAFGVTQVTKFDGDPLLWNIHNGKLYVNATPALQQKWLGKGLVNVVGNNLDKNIAEANKIWPTISKAKPEALFTAWAARQ